jgi:hypothetical protein
MKNLFSRILVLAMLMMLLCGNLSAQFSISGEFRPRAEYRDGYAKFRDSTMTPYASILGRSRLIFDYRSDKFLAKFTIQHAFVFGDNTIGQDTITRNTLNIYEGWFQYNFTKTLGFKLGRMEIIYDNQRLIGNSNWGEQGVTYDAGMLRWELGEKSYRGEFSFAVNNTSPPTPFLAPYPLKNFKYLAMMYDQKKLLKDQLIISFLAVLDVNQKASTSKTTTTNQVLYVVNGSDTIGTTTIPKTTTTVTSYPTMLFGRFTFGGTADYTWKKLKIYAEGYYQAGNYTDGRTLNAGMFGIHASYKVLKPLTLLLGYEKLSGNDFSDTTGLKTKTTSFSTLYGTAHSKYGYMDLYNTYVRSGNSAGLSQVWGRATVSLTDKMSLEATWRMFSLGYGYLSSSKKPGYVSVGKKLGNEFDFMLLYKVLNNFEVNAAYCFFLPTGTMQTFEGLTPGTAKFAQYAYVMLTYRPNFFTSEKK